MKPNLNRWMKLAPGVTGTADLLAATAAIQSALRTAPKLNLPLMKRRPETGTRVAPEAALKGSFVARDHVDARGRLDYRLYVPPQAGRAPLPLVVMLHGCTQDAEDFAAGTGMNQAAEAQGFFVLYPEQSQQANPQRCWNWFKHSHQTRGRGEPALLAGMVQAVMAEHAIDPDRVYVAGLSAGGAMAAILAATYPEVFAAVGVHSGLAAGAASDLPSALAAMRGGAAGQPAAAAQAVPTIVFHGDADSTVHPDNGTQVFEAAGRAFGGAGETKQRVQQAGQRDAVVRTLASSAGNVDAEHWLVHGAPHAWSGGSAAGSFTDPTGPDATAQMLRFFFAHSRQRAGSTGA